MRIIVAPDSFTGFCGARDAARLIGEGLLEAAARRGVALDLDLAPMADGGTGTLDVMEATRGGERVRTLVKDPLGLPVEAAYLRLPGGTAVVEMAQASGIERIARESRHPFLASTFGTGELLLHAHGAGGSAPPRRIVVALGGSATNDGGAGL